MDRGQERENELTKDAPLPPPAAGHDALSAVRRGRRALHPEGERLARVDGADVGLEVVLEVGAVRAVGAAEGARVGVGVQVAPQLPAAQERLGAGAAHEAVAAAAEGATAAAAAVAPAGRPLLQGQERQRGRSPLEHKTWPLSDSEAHHSLSPLGSRPNRLPRGKGGVGRGRGSWPSQGRSRTATPGGTFSQGHRGATRVPRTDMHTSTHEYIHK